MYCFFTKTLLQVMHHPLSLAVEKKIAQTNNMLLFIGTVFTEMKL